MTVKIGPDPYSQNYIKKMDSFYPNLWEHLEILPSLPQGTNTKVISYFLEMACQSSHIGNIRLGRESLASLPRGWLIERIDDIAKRSLDLNDDWEFRRLLEVYEILDNGLLIKLCQIGKENKNPAIQEAAIEFLES